MRMNQWIADSYAQQHAVCELPIVQTFCGVRPESVELHNEALLWKWTQCSQYLISVTSFAEVWIVNYGGFFTIQHR